MSVYDDPKLFQSQNQDVLNHIYETFFHNRPVTVDIHTQGQRLDEQNNFQIGCAVGPALRIEALFHEMGHLAERPIHKLLKKPFYAWGLSPGKYWQIGTHSGYQFFTDQAIQTEKQAWAYQRSLQKHFQIQEHPELSPEQQDVKLCEAVVWINDAFAIYKHRVLPKDFDDQGNYQNTDREAVRILSREIKHMSETTHTFQKFQEAWENRMHALA